MVDPFEARRVRVALAPEGALVLDAFGALVHDGSLRPREWQFLGIRLNEVLPDLGPDVFEEKPEMR